MALDTPSKGGRVVLTRRAVSDERVTYGVALHAPEGTWESAADIVVADGGITFDRFEGEGEAPTWLVDMARAFLRTVWSGRRGEDPKVWPRRVRRWRAPKR